ncbi:MAG: MFS transporter [Micrococcales bacterium]
MQDRTAVLFAATFAYFAAVMQRSSLGVASLEAATRFQASASQLAGLAVFQLAVYAAMQIPVGLLLDRFGPKRLLQIGSACMAIGQLLVAAASTISVAYLGRSLVGMGDAFTFISLLRLIVNWTPAKTAGRSQQVLVALGQLGQLASAIPFAIALANLGWTNSFSIAATVVVASFILVTVFVSNHDTAHTSVSLKVSWLQLIENIKFSGTRMSFWIHFTLQSSGSVFALLWGVPFLVAGEGQSRVFASSMLTLQILLSLVWGVAIGWMTLHRPKWRGRVIVSIACSIIAIWIVFALVPNRAPVWLLVVLVAVISVGGPASILAMDYSRGFIPKERLGTANGFINIGGFLATFVIMWLAGGVLDLVRAVRHTRENFSFDGFRWALSVQIIILVFGLIMYFIERRRTAVTHQV